MCVKSSKAITNDIAEYLMRVGVHKSNLHIAYVVQSTSYVCSQKNYLVYVSWKVNSSACMDV